MSSTRPAGTPTACSWSTATRPSTVAPRRDGGVELVVAGPALVEREVGEVGSADRRRARRPLVVVGAADDDPLVLAARRVAALRRPARVAVPGRRRHGAGAGEAGEGDAGHLGRHLELGEVDDGALAGLAALDQAERDGAHGGQAGDGIAVGDAGLLRRLGVVAGQRHQPGHHLDDRAVADVVAVGADLAEAGHADRGSGRAWPPARTSVAQAEVVHHVGPVVLDDDVAVGDEAQEHVPAGWPSRGPA